MRRHKARALDKAFAWTIAGLMFYFLTLTLPFISVKLSGQIRYSTVVTGANTLAEEGFYLLGAAVFLFSIAMPLAKLLLNFTVLFATRMQHPPAIVRTLHRVLKHLKPWSMVEVYMLGLFIAYTRLTALVQVDLDVAVYALIGLMISMAAADAAMDDETIWSTLAEKGLRHRPQSLPETILDTSRLVGCHNCCAVNDVEDHDCGRCGGVLHRRKPNSIGRSWALLIAAAMLYIPANGYAVMSTVKVGHELSHTILGGADELLEAGLWPLALLVFVASIMVPMLKFVSLATMLITIHRRSGWRIHGRTRLYRVIDFVGRWSMIDVFMISILVALVQFGQLAQVTSGSGAAAFASVVVLTMFATEMFDPRLMWDASGDNA